MPTPPGICCAAPAGPRGAKMSSKLPRRSRGHARTTFSRKARHSAETGDGGTARTNRRECSPEGAKNVRRGTAARPARTAGTLAHRGARPQARAVPTPRPSGSRFAGETRPEPIRCARISTRKVTKHGPRPTSRAPGASSPPIPTPTSAAWRWRRRPSPSTASNAPTRSC
jgi:hypothetical protein